MPSLPIAILHEHPDWFRPLFAALDRRALPWVRLDAAAHRWCPHEPQAPYALVVNRASPSAFRRGHAGAIRHTAHWLRHLERLGVPVVNGSAAYELELSKASQLDLLASLGLPFPRSCVVNAPSLAVDAARRLRYPVLIKANVGGSGAGIERFDDEASLVRAVDRGTLDFGVDDTALVQEALPLAHGRITRVETLGGRFLYAIHVYPEAGSFDLCPADACLATDGRELVRGACAVDAARNGMRVERADVSPEVIAEVERIARAAHLDVGGIEFLEDARDGERYYYDINALSNFVADAPSVIGFDPWERFVDWLVERAAPAATEPAEALVGAG